MEKNLALQEIKVPTEYKGMNEKVLGQANSIAVKDQDTYDIAVALGKAVSAEIKRREEFFGPRKKAAKAIHTDWCNLEKEALKIPKQAKGIIGNKLLAYEQEQERIRQEKEAELRRQAEEKARKEREEYERQQAEIAKKAESGDITPEEQDLFSEEFTPTVNPEDISFDTGFSKGGVTRTNWKAEVTDMRAFVEYCLNNGKLEWLSPIMPPLNKLAQAYKKDSDIPGVRFYNSPSKVL